MAGLAKVQIATDTLEKIGPVEITYNTRQRIFFCLWRDVVLVRDGRRSPMIGDADNPSDAVRDLLRKACDVHEPDWIEGHTKKRVIWQRRWRERPARWRDLDNPDSEALSTI